LSRIKPHVQRALEPKRESPIGIRKLKRGQAQVEHNAVRILEAVISSDVPHTCETRLNESDTTSVGSQALPAASYCCWIGV
jgi:hypothetical protein